MDVTSTTSYTTIGVLSSDDHLAFYLCSDLQEATTPQPAMIVHSYMFPNAQRGSSEKNEPVFIM